MSINVLVNGIGNIGSTILHLLCDYREELSIGTIHALKNREITPWTLPELELLQNRGVILHNHKPEDISGCKELSDLPKTINYIFDCTANGMGLANKDWYKKFPRLIGACAQGSESGFGIPFMSGINNSLCTAAPFVQVVSCNTHGMASIMKVFSGGDYSSYTDCDFVIVRRSEDIGYHQRLVSANVVSRHRDKDTGTHHATDLDELLQSAGFAIPVQSSDITTPSQLMHAVRFNLGFSVEYWKEISSEPDYYTNTLVSKSLKFDSNVIFEQGRRYGRYGRIYSQAIIITNNIIRDDRNRRIKGWAFIPQEGNTLVSVLHAFLLQTSHPGTASVLDHIRKDLIKLEW